MNRSCYFDQYLPDAVRDVITGRLDDDDDDDDGGGGGGGGGCDGCCCSSCSAKSSSKSSEEGDAISSAPAQSLKCATKSDSS